MKCIIEKKSISFCFKIETKRTFFGPWELTYEEIFAKEKDVLLLQIFIRLDILSFVYYIFKGQAGSSIWQSYPVYQKFLQH